MVGIGIHRRKK